MRVGEFLKQICDAQGPSQEQAVNVIEGLSPVGFAGLVTELGKQMAAADAVRPERVHRAKRQGGADGMGRMKQPGDRQHAGRDRHPVTMEALDWE